MTQTQIKSDSIQSLSIIVPFYDEEEAIPHLAERLFPVIEEIQRNWAVQLVLVDDGSSDDTYAKLREHFPTSRHGETTVLRHVQNRGIGAAMATGFEAASGDVVCTIDCDCTYAPEKLKGLVELLLSSNSDIATGSPYHPDGGVDGVKYWRLFISKGASLLYSLISSAKLHCYTSFFRAYRRRWARTELFESEGFLAVAEVLLRAAQAGAKVVEFPVRLGIRSRGISKMKVVRVTMQHLGLMSKLVLPEFVVAGFSDARSANKLAPWGEPVAAEGEDISNLLNRWILVGRVRGAV